MANQLRMHDEIRAWLAGLRDGEPELARPVGEAVLALLEAGESLGPPLVVPLAAPWPPEDPREVLDYSYQSQLELLQRVRRGIADVATSRKRIELQAEQLEQRAAKLARQREQALGAGQADLADRARTSEAGNQAQLDGLRSQLSGLITEEEKLTAAAARMQHKTEDFRTRKETVKASYTAAEASRRIRDALAELGAGTGELDCPEDPDEPGPGGRDDVSVPPGMMMLRPGAPGSPRAGLLFVLEPQKGAVLLARAEDPAAAAGDEQVIRSATGRLAQARSAGPDPAAAGRAFTGYDAESFLDEFFPGAETEVEIGAGALAARYRARTLTEARQRMKLTQAQVAQRMHVRQERVSAIERAEPGATEVRTLAAYVTALGGRLEIIAHIGGQDLRLR